MKTQEIRIASLAELQRRWAEAGLPADLLGEGILDNFLTIIFRKVMIDITKLDERLQRRFPAESDSSMQEVITRHYGRSASDFIENAFC